MGLALLQCKFGYCTTRPDAVNDASISIMFCISCSYNVVIPIPNSYTYAAYD